MIKQNKTLNNLFKLLNYVVLFCFGRMDGPAGNTKKQLPKRAQNPPKKMSFYEPDPGSPRGCSDGN